MTAWQIVGAALSAWLFLAGVLAWGWAVRAGRRPPAAPRRAHGPMTAQALAAEHDTGRWHVARCVVCTRPIYDGPRPLDGGSELVVTVAGPAHRPCLATMLHVHALHTGRHPDWRRHLC